MTKLPEATMRASVFSLSPCRRLGFKFLRVRSGEQGEAGWSCLKQSSGVGNLERRGEGRVNVGCKSV